MEVLSRGKGAFHQLSSVGSLKWNKHMNHMCLDKTTIGDICNV